MLKSCLGVCVLVASLFLATREGASQEIVHALTGSVSSINTANGTITLLHGQRITRHFQSDVLVQDAHSFR